MFRFKIIVYKIYLWKFFYVLNFTTSSYTIKKQMGIKSYTNTLMVIAIFAPHRIIIRVCCHTEDTKTIIKLMIKFLN